MKLLTRDHLLRNVKFIFPPKRIVSLVPSQTELLYDLGLENEIVGITRFCIHPKSIFREKVKVGGTKNFNIDKIRTLQPDLIIANKEENDKNGIEQLMKEFPVWVSNIYTFEDNLKMILDVGTLCNKIKEAKNIVDLLEDNFKTLHSINKKSVAYIIWNKPMMSINQNTFIHHILEKTGFLNIFAKNSDRYPSITNKELKKANPEYIFLSSEPYPFAEKHLKVFENEFPNSKVVLVDGEMFSWYGSRLSKTPKYIKQLLISL